MKGKDKLKTEKIKETNNCFENSEENVLIKRDLFFNNDSSLKDTSKLKKKLLNSNEINLLFNKIKENVFGDKAYYIIFTNIYKVLFILSLLISLFIQLPFSWLLILVKLILLIILIVFFIFLYKSLYTFLYNSIIFLNKDLEYSENIAIVDKGYYWNFWWGYIMFIIIIIIINLIFLFFSFNKNSFIIFCVLSLYIIILISSTIYKDTNNFKIAIINTFCQLNETVWYKKNSPINSMLLNAIIYMPPVLIYTIINK